MKNLAPHDNSKDPTLSKVISEKTTALIYYYMKLPKSRRLLMERIVKLRKALDNSAQPAQN